MSERDAQLREQLVNLAGQPLGAKRRAARTFVASVAAFAIAGAITGGTVAAVASSGDDERSTELDLVSARVVGIQLIGEHSPVVGEPFEGVRSGDGEIDLGPMPPEANSIAFALHCTTVGTLSFAFGDAQQASTSCEDEADTQPGHGMIGIFLVPDPSDNTISVSVDGSGGYSFWAAWVTRPAPPQTSAAQAEALADGIVDEAEYRAGLDRYIACMAEAGFTVDVLDTAGPVAMYVIGNDAVLDGADARCYAAEFRELDMQWQVSQPPTK